MEASTSAFAAASEQGNSSPVHLRNGREIESRPLVTENIAAHYDTD